MPTLRRIAREPLLHFLLLGGAVLAAYSLVSDPPAPPPREEIVVTQDEARQFANRFGAVWGRPPRPEELDALIDEYVREEVLVREALKLSIDRDDAVIRQRLAQKMRFLIESAAGSAAPSEDELREHFQANADDYERGARIAFEQVFLGESPSAAEVEAAREALLSGTAPGEVGQRILLPQAMPLTGARPVDGSFGEEFFQRLEQAEAGVRAGAVRLRCAPGAGDGRRTGRAAGLRRRARRGGGGLATRENRRTRGCAVPTPDG